MILGLRRDDLAWSQRYHAEAARLRAAFGYCTDGGVLYDSAHVGSTAVAGLAAQPIIDIVVDAYPLPLVEEKGAALTELGYTFEGEYGEGGEKFRRDAPDAVDLYLVALEGEDWSRLVVMGDYLTANQQARGRLNALKERLIDNAESYNAAKAEFFDENEPAAFRWHLARTRFRPVEALAETFRDAAFPWFVVSGWALDLFLGSPSRYHHDLDISVWYRDQLELRAYLLARGWALHRLEGEGEYVVWEEGYRLEPPYHQIHARRDGDFLDILLSSRDAANWRYRRDDLIERTLEQALMTSRGVTHLVPELVLLFKSNTSGGDPRPRDQQDFDRVLPRLSADQKDWLYRAISRRKPDHSWLSALR